MHRICMPCWPHSDIPDFPYMVRDGRAGPYCLLRLSRSTNMKYWVPVKLVARELLLIKSSTQAPTDSVRAHSQAAWALLLLAQSKNTHIHTCQWGCTNKDNSVCQQDAAGDTRTTRETNGSQALFSASGCASQSPRSQTLRQSPTLTPEQPQPQEQPRIANIHCRHAFM